ncbi:hypothetical protein GEMRC1_009451 [Eukaryota sp. GEM-RC1]
MIEEDTSRRILAAFQAKDRSIADLKSSLAAAHDKNDSIAMKLSTCTQEYQAKIRELEQKISLVLASDKPSSTSNSSAQTQTSLTSCDLDDLFQSFNEKNNTIQDLNDKLSKANSTISDLRASKKDILLALTDKEKTVEALSDRCDKLSSLDKESSTIIQKQNSQLLQQHSVLAELRQELSLYNSSVTSSASHVSVQTGPTPKDRDAEVKQLAQVKEACVTINKLRGECQKYMDKASGYEEMLDEKNAELAKVNHELAQLSSREQGLIEENDELVKEIKTMDDVIDGLREEVALLKKNESRQQESELIESQKRSEDQLLLKKYHQADAERSSLSRQILHLRSQLETVQNERDALIEEVQKSEENSRNLLQEYQSLKDDISNGPRPKSEMTSRGIMTFLPYNTFPKHVQTDALESLLPIFPLSEIPSKDLNQVLLILPTVSNWFSSLNIDNGVILMNTLIEVLESQRTLEDRFLQSFSKLQDDTIATVITSRAQLATLSPKKIEVPKLSALVCSQKAIIHDLRKKLNSFDQLSRKLGGEKLRILVNSTFLSNLSINKVLKTGVLSNRIQLLNKRIALLNGTIDAQKGEISKYLHQIHRLEDQLSGKAEAQKQAKQLPNPERRKILSELKALEKLKSKLVSENSSIKQKLKHSSSEISRKDSIIENLKSEVETIRTVKEELVESVTKLESKNSNLSQEVKRLSYNLDQRRLNQSVVVNASQVAQISKDFNNAVDNFSKEKKLLNSRLSRLTQTLKSQKSVITDLTEKKAEIEALNDTLAERVSFLQSSMMTQTKGQKSRSTVESPRESVLKASIEMIISLVENLIDAAQPELKKASSIKFDQLQDLPFSEHDLEMIMSSTPYDSIKHDCSSLKRQLFQNIQDQSVFLEHFEKLLTLLSDAVRVNSESSAFSLR